MPRYEAMAGLVRQAEAEIGATATVGVGIPGCISPATGLVKNANSNALNGHPFDKDLGALLKREIRVANDANCFALSEATDGAAAGLPVVFGVILGTGCGGGIVVHGRILEGRHRLAGEFGHTPLPWPEGRRTALPPMLVRPQRLPRTLPLRHRPRRGFPRYRRARRHRHPHPRRQRATPNAQAALDRHADRLARALANITNLLDPDAIVLGGGLSNLPHLYKVAARPHAALHLLRRRLPQHRPRQTRRLLRRPRRRLALAGLTPGRGTSPPGSARARRRTSVCRRG